MIRLRQVVKEFNIYRWAADLISGLSEIRLESGIEAESGRLRTQASTSSLRETAPAEVQHFSPREQAGY